jgi:hypothetical protein
MPASISSDWRVCVRLCLSCALRLPATNPHATPARVNAADAVLIESGTAMIAPSRSLTTPMKALARGKRLVGSGKLENPCRRMHPATLRQCASVAADGYVLAPGRGRPVGS